MKVILLFGISYMIKKSINIDWGNNSNGNALAPQAWQPNLPQPHKKLGVVHDPCWGNWSSLTSQLKLTYDLQSSRRSCFKTRRMVPEEDLKLVFDVCTQLPEHNWRACANTHTHTLYVLQ